MYRGVLHSTMRLLKDQKIKSRKILVTLMLLCVLFTSSSITWWWFHDPAVHWSKIEATFSDQFARCDGGTSQDRSWIPFSVRHHPRRHYLDWKRSRRKLVFGFPNMNMGYCGYHENHHIMLSIHLYENYARGMTVFYDALGRDSIHTIQKKIDETFPRLPVQFIEHHDVFSTSA